MKKLLLILLLLPSICHSQSKVDGYANAGFSLFASEKFQTTPGIFIGFGFYTGNIGIGVTGDLYTFSKKKVKYAVAAADFKIYFEEHDKPVSPFIAVQPGLVIYNKTVLSSTTKGSFAIEGMAGMRVKPNGNWPGFIFALGYQNISFKSAGIITHYGGIKLNIGISI